MNFFAQFSLLISILPCIISAADCPGARTRSECLVQRASHAINTLEEVNALARARKSLTDNTFKRDIAAAATVSSWSLGTAWIAWANKETLYYSFKQMCAALPREGVNATLHDLGCCCLVCGALSCFFVAEYQEECTNEAHKLKQD